MLQSVTLSAVVPSTTRRRILDSALVCFLDEGYEHATIARIRERSEVSNGALFHHFSSKEGIADAIYVEAISSFQEGLWQLVRSQPQSPRAALRRAIGHQLRWVQEHPELARFVYLRGHLEWDSPGASELLALNRELAAAFKEWIRPLMDAGLIRPISMLMLTAVVSGPAHAIARRWLSGQVDRDLSEYVDELADAAWAALRGPAAALPPQK
jgi:AcrR family transcriptional regulator